MGKYNRIIFVCQSGTARAQMASAIMKRQIISENMEIEAKGLVVLMPEPINQKAEAVMQYHGLNFEKEMSKQLTEEDFGDSTLVVTMNMQQKQKIYSDYKNAKNVCVLSEIAGEEGEILDPYGGPLTGYEKCFEEIQELVTKMTNRLGTIN